MRSKHTPKPTKPRTPKRVRRPIAISLPEYQNRFDASIKYALKVAKINARNGGAIPILPECSVLAGCMCRICLARRVAFREGWDFAMGARNAK